MKSIDTYLCKQEKKEFSFIFMGVDYFVGDSISKETQERMLWALKNQPIGDLQKEIKLGRFIATEIVDCAL